MLSHQLSLKEVGWLSMGWLVGNAGSFYWEFMLLILIIILILILPLPPLITCSLSLHRIVLPRWTVWTLYREYQSDTLLSSCVFPWQTSSIHPSCSQDDCRSRNHTVQLVWSDCGNHPGSSWICRFVWQPLQESYMGCSFGFVSKGQLFLAFLKWSCHWLASSWSPCPPLRGSLTSQKPFWTWSTARAD